MTNMTESEAIEKAQAWCNEWFPIIAQSWVVVKPTLRESKDDEELALKLFTEDVIRRFLAKILDNEGLGFDISDYLKQEEFYHGEIVNIVTQILLHSNVENVEDLLDRDIRAMMRENLSEEVKVREILSELLEHTRNEMRRIARFYRLRYLQ